MGLDSDNGSEATLTFGYYGDLWSLIKAYWDDVGIETEMSAMGGGAPASFAVAARLAPKPAPSVRQIMLRKKVRQIPRLAPRHNGAKQQGNDYWAGCNTDAMWMERWRIGVNGHLFTVDVLSPSLKDYCAPFPHHLRMERLPPTPLSATRCRSATPTEPHLTAPER